jgi:hypothetical protein
MRNTQRGHLSSILVEQTQCGGDGSLVVGQLAEPLFGEAHGGDDLGQLDPETIGDVLVGHGVRMASP